MATPNDQLRPIRPNSFPSSDYVDLTCQHKNREVLVEGPEITVRPVGTRRLAAGGGTQ